MKSGAIIAMLILCLIVCVIWGYLINGKNKDLGKQNVLLQQKIDGQAWLIKENSRDYLALKEKTDEQIAELRGMVDSANFVIEKKEEEIATQDERLASLREAQKVLTNKDDIIENLKTQIFIMDKKFVLAKDQLREKDKIIFSLNAQYEAEHKLRLQAESLLDEYARQVADQDLMIKNLKKMLGHQKRVSLYSKVGAFAIGVLATAIID